ELGASALAGPLRKAGLRVELVGGEPPDDELFEKVRGVAVLWGPGGKPPWTVKDLELCLRIFSRQATAKLALRLPDSAEPPVLPPEWQEMPWINLGPALSPACVTVIRRELAGERSAVALGAAAAAPGQAFTEPLTGIRFLWIPGG